METKYKEDLSLPPNLAHTTEIHSEDELEKEGDINLTSKSLKNTKKFPSKPKKEALPMKSIIDKILSKDISKRKYQKSIFSEKKQNLKKVEKEKLNSKLKAIKRHIKKKQINIGRKLPNFSKERDYERNLKMVAVEGLTKLFNAMAGIQKESLDEVLKMQINDKIGRKANEKKQNNKRNNNKGKKGGGFLKKEF